VRIGEVFDVLDPLTDAGVRWWLAGGWGVAALLGRQTREHRDVDLAVDADDLAACRQVLAELGYRPETDWLPVRVELRAPGDRWVDVHPVVFDATGHGRQAGFDGAHFDYPPEAFANGTLDGRPVTCLSVRQQLAFHAGYQPRPQDAHDIAILNALAAS
jgi:lincosamide nucleotidyltransferase A/C/D/E